MIFFGRLTVRGVPHTTYQMFEKRFGGAPATSITMPPSEFWSLWGETKEPDFWFREIATELRKGNYGELTIWEEYRGE